MKEKIKSLTSNRNRKLRYDFLPPMLEIMERPANPLGTFIVWAIAFIIVTAIIWASLFRLDIAVSAQGYVMPQGKLITVQTLSSGIIDKVYVDDEEVVTKGDPILSLEQTQLFIQLEELKYDLNILETQYDAYTNVQNEISVKDFDLNKYGDNSYIAKAILAEYELYLCELKEYERTASQGEEYRNLRDCFIKEHNLSILQNLNSLHVKIHDTEMSIEKIEKQIDESIIKAPESGKISQLNCSVEGSSLPSGEVVCYIIPNDCKMQFEAYVSDNDIKDIHVGDEVKVKLALYKDTDNEIVSGSVVKISDVAVTTQSGMKCYKVEIELERTESLSAHVGTTGVCDIIVGSRSVLDYFMEPFRKGLKDSLKEQ